MGYRIMNAEGRHVTTVAVVNRVVEHYVPAGGYIEEEGTGKVTFRQGDSVPTVEPTSEDAPVEQAEQVAEAAPKAKAAPRKRGKKK